MRCSNIMSPGIYLPIHHWRTNRYCISQLIIRHRTTRHILCSSTLPLCTINRSCIRYHSRIYPLIPTIHRILIKPIMSKITIRSNILRCKHNIFPTTLPRSSRHTTTILRLPRRLYNMKLHLINWINNLNSSSYHNASHYLRILLIKTKNSTN